MTLEHHMFKTMPYLLSQPEQGEENEGKPLILFLHGVGERGTDLQLIKQYGIPDRVATVSDFPFITVSPQCPKDSYWTEETETLKELLIHCVQTYKADPERVYLTGLSMGGAGAWRLAIDHPHLFAALAPICGKSYPKEAHALKGLPVWIFHGEEDDVNPLTHSKDMAEALLEEGADVLLTVYPEVGHDSWTKAYETEELYRWFLSHKNSEYYKNI